MYLCSKFAEQIMFIWHFNKLIQSNTQAMAYRRIFGIISYIYLVHVERFRQTEILPLTTEGREVKRNLIQWEFVFKLAFSPEMGKQFGLNWWQILCHIVTAVHFYISRNTYCYLNVNWLRVAKPLEIVLARISSFSISKASTALGLVYIDFFHSRSSVVRAKGASKNNLRFIDVVWNVCIFPLNRIHEDGETYTINARPHNYTKKNQHYSSEGFMILWCCRVTFSTKNRIVDKFIAAHRTVPLSFISQTA